MVSRIRQACLQLAISDLNRFIVILVVAVATASTGKCDDDSTTVRVAAVSFEPIKFDLAANTKTLETWFRRAAEGGAQIAVAPEGALEGYVVNEIVAGEEDAQRMREVAVSIESSTIDRFRDLARELEMCLVFGFAERIDDDVFNSAVFIDNKGNISGKYHKMQLAEGYHESWWFNRLGKQSRAFDTPYGRCGILICNDRWNPQLARIPALDGAQFLVIPSFGSKSKAQDEAVLARGVENDLPIIEANVGVTLIVNDNQIAEVDRRISGITFGEISVPPARPVQPAARDQEEADFLRWRDAEMPVRLARKLVETGEIAPTTQTGEIDWYDARQIGIEGKAWDDTESFYDRLPARAKERVRPPVWSLSQDSAGMCVRFMTDAQSIRARWTLRSDQLAMPHMPATGVSGVDLYVRHEGAWRWLANGKPIEKTNNAQLVTGLPPSKREYLLYLPLYNGVTLVELGVNPNARLWRKTFDEGRLPIVFWGTSITQGACASRPGMCHTAILGRRLERPIINLGFSGNGRMEPEVAELVSEIDAALYVIDCLPNVNADVIRERTKPLVEIIRQSRPHTPILLVEDRTYSDAFLVESKQRRNATSRVALRDAFEQLRRDGVKQFYYLPGDGLLGLDGEDTVDSSHPTDLGFFRQANAFESAMRPILAD